MKTLALLLLLLLLLTGCAVTKYENGAVVSQLTTCFGINIGVNETTKTPTLQAGLIRHESLIAPKDTTYHAETKVTNSGHFNPLAINRAVIMGQPTNNTPLWRMGLPEEVK